MVRCSHCDKILNTEFDLAICSSCKTVVPEDSRAKLIEERDNNLKTALEKFLTKSLKPQISDDADFYRKTAGWLTIAAFLIAAFGAYRLFDHDKYGKDISDLIKVVQGAGLIGAGLVCGIIASVIAVLSLKK